jgi:hypothetical protein
MRNTKCRNIFVTPGVGGWVQEFFLLGGGGEKQLAAIPGATVGWRMRPTNVLNKLMNKKNKSECDEETKNPKV